MKEPAIKVCPFCDREVKVDICPRCGTSYAKGALDRPEFFNKPPRQATPWDDDAGGFYAYASYDQGGGA